MRLRARIIPRIEENPRVVCFAQRPAGQLGLLGVFSALVWLHGMDTWWGIGLAVAGTTFLPRWRRPIVAIATLALLGSSSPMPLFDVALGHDRATAGLDVHVAWAVCLLLPMLLWLGLGPALHSLRRWARLDRPVLVLLVGFGAYVGALSCLPAEGLTAAIGWGVANGLARTLWFFAYTARDRRARRGGARLTEVASYHPFWSDSAVPFPKAGSYLDRIEAKTPEELAVCQLKAVKLLAWAALLALLQLGMSLVLYGRPRALHEWLGGWSLAVADYPEALSRAVAGAPLPFYSNAAAVAAAFALRLLEFAIWGHRIVAVCRMAGFRALRNTYRPLASRSIADFWNRVYFYFKELLVDFFFYPAYMRYFRAHPRLRLLFATFAAAGVGNVIYHYLRDLWAIHALGFRDSLVSMQVYAVYATLLATGIGVSQLRSRRPAHPATPSVLRRALTLAGVLAFYGALSVLDQAGRQHTLLDVARFARHLLP